MMRNRRNNPTRARRVGRALVWGINSWRDDSMLRLIVLVLLFAMSSGVLRADDPREVVEFKIVRIANRFGGAMYYSVRENGKRIEADIVLPGGDRTVTADEVKALATLDCPLELELSGNVELTPAAWKEFASLK